MNSNPMNTSDTAVTRLVMGLSAMSAVGGVIFLSPYALAGLGVLTAVMVPIGYARGAFKPIDTTQQ